MAKVKLINVREHDITLHTPKNGHVIIPAAKQNPDDRSKLIHGEAECEDALFAEAKKSEAVQNFFKEGWLRIPKQQQEKEEPKK